MASLILRKGADKRLRGGHLWIYSNEIDTTRSPLHSYAAGDRVGVLDAAGHGLGSAYMEPQSLICARLFSTVPERELDQHYFFSAASRALLARQSVFPEPYYRLIYGDSDWIPGVVVDRFGDYLVLQLNNAGIERYEEAIVAALVALLAPAGILLRADSRARRELGLQDRIEVVHGDVPATVPFMENGVRFMAPVWDGQKTGWFYDHRMARARLRDYVQGKTVLDVYSYIGGWGVQAAAFGANAVCCLDSSEPALERVLENAQLNQLADVVTTKRGSAPETMTAMLSAGSQFDVVVLDPPAFIQRRKDIKKGIAAYRRINELGLRLLAQGGMLVSASCSMHLTRADLITAIGAAANRIGIDVQIMEQGGQGPDHPIHPAIPETEYLKSVFVRRLPSA